MHPRAVDFAAQAHLTSAAMLESNRAGCHPGSQDERRRARKDLPFH
jgi:hypothetical protein